ncbi:MAG: paraslipin [Desulfobulbus sp.]|nr:MAG: paraslipin [Desulfobulbus sp.]
MEMLVGVGVLVAFVFFLLVKTAVVVPQRNEFVVERLGKYRTTLGAGLHILIPFIDKVAYKRNLKEEPIDIPAQSCITADNVSMQVDGVLYLQVINAQQSAYGVEDYRYAATQLAQTSLRSAIGKIQLDNTFEARETLNMQVVDALDEATRNWGIKVLRYEIKDIEPPRTVLEAMEKQMRAEREKRAEIFRSEGERQALINLAEGQKMKMINEADGRAQEILRVAAATAEGIRKVAEALSLPGGQEAASLEVAKKYIEEFGKLAKENNTMILPGNLTDVASMVATAMSAIKQSGSFQPKPQAPSA